ncbi:D-alanyl-lipoteichoic acid acyltransferase DltB (MBOAT superfamily) [Roseiarcus fermentans]|uniref:Probable alginate O-acetylase AlgI n=1 Tax=Roseiarcus fermentans TaxID=1473586 RepID=A0A366FUB8_9HYPH|nr:MBOAT family O-acyltransferase [Roseiarcus fermentans]RBP17756.1 D-alanyl-lipoteichoic acid acyltransferase DltB (MBOAT superfamily) [Roseiarcus fermentans]
MLFNSFPFLFGFLPLALVLTYWAGRRPTPTLAKATLAALSLGFYAWWRPVYLWLLLFSIAFNYLVGDQIQKAVAAKRQQASRLWLTVGLVVDIGMLGYFKYANFFVDNVRALTGADWTLDHIVLPLAISFYTFQKIAYLVDSSRGEARRMSLLDFTLFAAFFPQLIAGPIVHYKEVVPQLQGPLFGRLIGRNLLVGLAIMAIGLAKKTVIADTASGYADQLFLVADKGGAVDFVSGWLAAILYTFQVYFDFSGYSDMAIGLGRMFGVKLPLNFHSPLRAANIADYWRRWHMTLQRMIYAYVFQPLSLSLIRSTWRLGLSGWGAFAVSVGLPTFLTFVIVGVWHGAGWTFVLFGVMHAVYVSAFEIWRERRTKLQRRLRKLGRKLAEPGPARRAAARVVTLVAILAANVVFRAKTVGAAATVWTGMAGLRGGFASAPAWDVAATVVVCAAIVAFFPNTQQIMSRFDPAYNWKEWSDVARPPIAFAWRPNTVGLIALGVVLFLGVTFIQRGQAVFLYFNF